MAKSSAQRDDLSASDRQRVASVTRPAEDFSKPERFEAMAAGAATVRDFSIKAAFDAPSASLSFEQRGDFNLGEALFAKLWVSSPASTKASDGLGPLFNARACSSCHIGNGRGRAPDGTGDAGSLVLGLRSGHGPYEIYGAQLQTRAVQGHAAEAEVTVSYEDVPVRLDDGTLVMLRKPNYDVGGLAYGALGPDTSLLPRLAPPLLGLGLVEQIALSDLEALSDPDDRDGDGISGRLNRVRDPHDGSLVAGRFGWKASQPSVRVQSAAAFNVDIGLSTTLFPQHAGDCTPAQRACLAAPHGAQAQSDDVEVSDAALDLVAFYSAHITVPARRDVNDPQVLKGKELFYRAGCVSCHQPKFVTLRDPDGGPNSFQLIWPYSDFLLHDMGEGLADPGSDPLAREWRTPPLWGIGLTQAVLKHGAYLHDGRARSLTEAVLWHGGEAAAARDAFAAMHADERRALVRFLKSL
ncbi:di-heme oxidoredictase family protein [Hoeflea prorocentri]|nr:di-heme oxidoredictase family protein [Hoeflea prorocentri]